MDKEEFGIRAKEITEDGERTMGKQSREMDETADKTATATTATDKIECGSAVEKRLRIGETERCEMRRCYGVLFLLQ